MALPGHGGKRLSDLFPAEQDAGGLLRQVQPFLSVD